MAQMLHTQQEKQNICAETRRMLREGAKFATICAMLQLKPTTLRAWLNNQTRDWIYPQVPNQGRI